MQTTNGSFQSSRSSSFESLNYDEAENELVRARLGLPSAERHQLRRRELAVMWALLLTTGALIGSIAFFASYIVAQVVRWKFDVVQAALDRGAFLEGWAILTAFVLVLATSAALLTWWAPEAAGSGIPHVKAYLNGNRLDGALRPRTLIAKVIGIMCCVAAGMPAGREGPMVHGAHKPSCSIPACAWPCHREARPSGLWRAPSLPCQSAPSLAPPRPLPLTHSRTHSRRAAATALRTVAAGAIVANLVGTGRSNALHRYLRVNFHNDFDRRNFVSMGAAAGVAAAFNAPIGGILFSLEEVSSFWDPHLTLLSFFMVATASLTVSFWRGGIADGAFGTFTPGTSGLVLFEHFTSAGSSPSFQCMRAGQGDGPTRLRLAPSLPLRSLAPSFAPRPHPPLTLPLPLAP